MTWSIISHDLIITALLWSLDGEFPKEKCKKTWRLDGYRIVERRNQIWDVSGGGGAGLITNEMLGMR